MAGHLGITAAGLQVPKEAFQPSGSGDGYADRVARKGRVLYDSGAVGAGAAINSGVLDLTGVEDLLIVADNAAGAATRALTADVYLDDGVTAIVSALALRTVAIGAKELVTIGAGAIATGLTAAFSLPLPTKMKITLAAGGAANGRLTVYGR